MLTRNNFYVTLPSNGSKNYFPDNSAAVFRNHLANSIELEGAWEVALVEIQYPITWKLLSKPQRVGLLVFLEDKYFGSIKGEEILSDMVMAYPKPLYGPKGIVEEFKKRSKELAEKPETANGPINRYKIYKADSETEFEIYFIDRVPNQEIGSLEYIETRVNNRWYLSPKQVANGLATRLVDAFHVQSRSFGAIEKVAKDEIFTASFDADSSSIRFNSNLNCKLVHFKESNEMFRIMGFDPIDSDMSFDTVPFYTASLKPQMKLRTPALYVYSDIVCEELVGNFQVPLLRAVAIEGEMSDFVHKEFIRPYYKPVNTGYINDILVEIKDDTGNDIEFTVGKVVCTLHFRRCGLAA